MLIWYFQVIDCSSSNSVNTSEGLSNPIDSHTRPQTHMKVALWKIHHFLGNLVTVWGHIWVIARDTGLESNSTMSFANSDTNTNMFTRVGLRPLLLVTSRNEIKVAEAVTTDGTLTYWWYTTFTDERAVIFFAPAQSISVHMVHGSGCMIHCNLWL